MPAGQVVALPNNFGRGGVQTGRAIAAEMEVNATGFNRQRRSGVAINIIAQRLRNIAVKKFFVETYFPGINVQTQGEEVMSIFRGSGQPDLAVHYYWRGPAAIWYLGFPFDVFRFAPMEWKADEVGVSGRRDMAITPRPAKFRPVRSSSGRATGERDQEGNGNGYGLLNNPGRLGAIPRRLFDATHASTLARQIKQV